MGKILKHLAQATHQRPSDIAEKEGSAVDKFLFDLSVFGSEETVGSVSERIRARRAAEWQNEGQN
jgi:hypothetical protein